MPRRRKSTLPKPDRKAAGERLITMMGRRITAACLGGEFVVTFASAEEARTFWHALLELEGGSGFEAIQLERQFALHGAGPLLQERQP